MLLDFSIEFYFTDDLLPRACVSSQGDGGVVSPTQTVGPRVTKGRATAGEGKKVTRKSVQWPIGNPPLSEKACSNANVASCPGLENAFLYILGQKLR